jgi:hypothetical protein
MLFTKSTLYVSSSVNILESLNIPVGRINKDSVKNHYGSRLLDLCKGNDLFIINGRIGNDKGIGKLTCKNSSVVDYVISSVDKSIYVGLYNVLNI